jgi:hypothetical protein
MDSVDNYIANVLKHIRNKEAHKEISDELRSHIAELSALSSTNSIPIKLENLYVNMKNSPDTKDSPKMLLLKKTQRLYP